MQEIYWERLYPINGLNGDIRLAPIYDAHISRGDCHAINSKNRGTQYAHTKL
jgi:hypothetical protein